MELDLRPVSQSHEYRRTRRRRSIALIFAVVVFGFVALLPASYALKHGSFTDWPVGGTIADVLSAIIGIIVLRSTRLYGPDIESLELTEDGFAFHFKEGRMWRQTWARVAPDLKIYRHEPASKSTADSLPDIFLFTPGRSPARTFLTNEAERAFLDYATKAGMKVVTAPYRVPGWWVTSISWAT